MGVDGAVGHLHEGLNERYWQTWNTSAGWTAAMAELAQDKPRLVLHWGHDALGAQGLGLGLGLGLELGLG